MEGTVYFIVWVFWVAALLVLYHKVFTVHYFNLGQGLLKEIVGACILGLLMTGLTFYLWWLAAILIVIAGFALRSKTSNNAVLIAAFICAGLVCVFGLNLKKQMKEEDNAETAEEDADGYEDGDMDDGYDDYDDDGYDGYDGSYDDSYDDYDDNWDDDDGYSAEDAAGRGSEDTAGEEGAADDAEPGIQETDMDALVGYYLRETGPACGLYISSADEDNIYFAIGIGASGSQAYIDMRDCQAEWVESDTADYTDGAYSLTLTALGDGRIALSESGAYNEDFPLDGEYVSDGIAGPECEYVFPDSDILQIGASELEGLTAAECRIARNEIYARHGRMFSDGQLQNYFDACSWYEGTVAPEEFSDDMLNEVEKANLQAISEYENGLGG